MRENDYKYLIKYANKLSYDFSVDLKYKSGDKNGEFNLNPINVFAAFCPVIWDCLSSLQRLISVLIAIRRISVKIKNFCNIENSFDIFVVKDSGIYFNIGILENNQIDALDILTSIINYKNYKKKIMLCKKYCNAKSIFNFEKFEDLEYANQLKLNTSEEIQDFSRAIYLNQKAIRDYRLSEYEAINLILFYTNEIGGNEIDNYYSEKLNLLIEEDNFVSKVLGEDKLTQDYYYLRIINNIFNSETNEENRIGVADALKFFKSHFGEDFLKKSLN